MRLRRVMALVVAMLLMVSVVVNVVRAAEPAPAPQAPNITAPTVPDTPKNPDIRPARRNVFDVLVGWIAVWQQVWWRTQMSMRITELMGPRAALNWLSYSSVLGRATENFIMHDGTLTPDWYYADMLRALRDAGLSYQQAVNLALALKQILMSDMAR